MAAPGETCSAFRRSVADTIRSRFELTLQERERETQVGGGLYQHRLTGHSLAHKIISLQYRRPEV